MKHIFIHASRPQIQNNWVHISAFLEIYCHIFKVLLDCKFIFVSVSFLDVCVIHYLRSKVYILAEKPRDVEESK